MCRIQNGKSKIKSKAVRGEKVTVSIVILFHMATSSTFHSCYSFQMFLSGAAALLALLHALLSDTRNAVSTSLLKADLNKVRLLSGHFCDFKTSYQGFYCYFFVRSIWILDLNRYDINTVYCIYTGLLYQHQLLPLDHNAVQLQKGNGPDK